MGLGVSGIRGFVPLQQASQLVSHIDHHHFLARASQVSDFALDGLAHTGVDGTTESTVRSHANDQMLCSLVLWRLDVSLLIQSWRAKRKQWNLNPVAKILISLKSLRRETQELCTHPQHRCHRLGLASAASQHEHTWQQPPFSWIL